MFSPVYHFLLLHIQRRISLLCGFIDSPFPNLLAISDKAGIPPPNKTINIILIRLTNFTVFIFALFVFLIIVLIHNIL